MSPRPMQEPRQQSGGTERSQMAQQFADQLKSEIVSSLTEARDKVSAAGDQVTAAKLDAAIAKLGATRDIVPAKNNSHTGRAFFDENFIPQRAVDITQALGTTLVLCVLGFPLVRSFARWLDRRGTTPPSSREVLSRLEAIEKAVESVAVEVERVSEGQRFTTKLLNERAQEPARALASVEGDPLAVALPVNARRT